MDECRSTALEQRACPGRIPVGHMVCSVPLMEVSTHSSPTIVSDIRNHVPALDLGMAERSLLALLEAEVRPWGGWDPPGGLGMYDPASSSSRLVLAPPGSPLVDRRFLGAEGAAPDAFVARLSFAADDVFLSTDRASLLPGRRPPVSDVYWFLLQRGGIGSFRILERACRLRLVPFPVALRVMDLIFGDARFAALLETFLEIPCATRLSQRYPAAPVGQGGLIRRILGRPKPDFSLPPPPRQLKVYFDRRLEPGSYRFGDLFQEARALKEHRFGLTRDAVAMTIELIEGTTARHVHWRFRGTLVRAVVSLEEVVVFQHFRI